jgi:hypothetical protein
MRRSPLILLGFVLPFLMSARPEQRQVPAQVDKLHAGMTQAEVWQLLGPAQHVARQILYRRYLEQWLYEGPIAVRIEFDCVRGKEPQILTVHPLTPPQP